MPRLFQYLPLLLATLCGCGRCGVKPVALTGPEDLLPAAIPGLVRVPSLARLGVEASALAKSLMRFPEGEAVQSSLDLFAGQLGFDPRTPAGLRSAGLDGARPAALALEGGGPFAVLPVFDRARFAKTVARLAADRLGAGPGVTEGEVTVFRGKTGAAAFGFRGDYAVIATRERAGETVARVLGQTPEQSLARLPLYRLSMQRLTQGQAVVAWAPAGSPLLPAFQLPGRAFALGLTFENGRLQVHFLSSLSVSEGMALAALSLPAGQALVSDLAPGSPFVLRIGGEPAMLSGAWVRLPAAVRRPIEAAGLDVPTEILHNLAPGIALSLGLAPHLDLSAAPTFDPQRQNPFRYVTLDALGQVHDSVKGAATLEKIYAAAPTFGATVGKRHLGAQEIATFSYDKGEGVSVALVGHSLVVTGGEGEMDAALARLAGKSPGYVVPKELERPLRGSVSSGAVLDTDALREAVARIPPSAYGGLTGLTVHALVSRFMEPLALVGPLTVTLSLDADALTAEAGVTLR